MVPRGMGVVLNAMSQAGSVRRMNETFENWTGQGTILCPKKDICQVQTRCKCNSKRDLVSSLH